MADLGARKPSHILIPDGRDATGGRFTLVPKASTNDERPHCPLETSNWLILGLTCFPKEGKLPRNKLALHPSHHQRGITGALGTPHGRGSQVVSVYEPKKSRPLSAQNHAFFHLFFLPGPHARSIPWKAFYGYLMCHPLGGLP